MHPTRRTVLTTCGAALATTQFAERVWGQWRMNDRYPDPAVEALDPSFAKYRLALASVERLATGMRWSEGPVWFGDGRYLLWSDIPNNRIMRWQEETGAVSVSDSLPIMPTATPAIAKAASSPANMMRGGSRVPSTMVLSLC